MEMQQVRYFLAVCEAGNFTRASEACFVSQPSLTLAIQKLEEEMGGRLFDRDRSGCRLTELGRLVEPGMRIILEQSHTVKQEAVRFLRLRKTPLRVGLTANLGAGRLGPLLARFQKEVPSAEVEIVVESEAHLLKRLQKGSLDAVLAALAGPPGAAFESRVLYRERYGVAYPAGHRFASKASLDLADLQDEPYLDRLNCEMRETVRGICVDRRVALYATYRSNDEDWILHMVRGGLGIAILPEHTVPADAAGIGFRYLGDPALDREIAAVVPSGGKEKKEVRALIRFLARGGPGGP
jgi:DNA-binding transcriptional LysR family regulator